MHCQKRYLWVDKYCITQEDHSVRAHEIRHMGQVYNGAYATICRLLWLQLIVWSPWCRQRAEIAAANGFHPGRTRSFCLPSNHST